jgi:hypothetical protein
MTETDRVEFARRANEATVSSMSATEIAKMDAGRLSDSILGLFVANDDGRLNTYENKQFIFRMFCLRFLQSILETGYRSGMTQAALTRHISLMIQIHVLMWYIR